MGMIYLVGAGPGDAGLITVRGADCLRRADVVLYDYLVNPDLLRHAPHTAERICLGSHGSTRIWSQDEIHARMAEDAAQGKTVVRLKGGDPAVFAHIGDEMEFLAARHIPYEVVPGITAAWAVSSYAGIPLTHRDRELASAVALITGQETPHKDQPTLDYHALAMFPGTLVFYMGVTTSARWSQALIAAGKPADTPVAMVRRCSCPDQQIVRCTLAEVAERLTPRQKLPPPVIILVGPVVNDTSAFSWFDQRPLFGQRILVTRPITADDALRDRLREWGADVIESPVITIGPPPDWHPVDGVIDRLSDFDWVVFSSCNGVEFFLQRVLSRGRDMRALGRARLAAIGPGTAERLLHYQLRADVIPDEYRAESLAAALAEQVRGQQVLLIRASRGREVLAETLTAHGACITQVVAYRSEDVASAPPEVLQRLQDGKIDWVTVTSSAIARSLVRLFGESLRHARLASISPVTSATLRELSFSPDVEASPHDTIGLAEAIRQACQ